MDKAVLIFDSIKTGCVYCPEWKQGILSESWICEATEKGNFVPDKYGYGGDGRPKWCPRRPIPEYIEENVGSQYDLGYVDGWNDCLNMIGVRMGKEMLILDKMPEACGDCFQQKIGMYTESRICIAVNHYFVSNEYEDACRPNWCPIHLLPERLEKMVDITIVATRTDGMTVLTKYWGKRKRQDNYHNKSIRGKRNGYGF